MSPGRIVAVILGAVLALVAVGLLIGGGLLAFAYAVESEDGGYFDETLDRVGTATAAITTEEVDLRTNPGPGWGLDALDVSIRLQATSVDESSELFIGIGPQADVNAYLSGTAHDEISDIRAHGSLEYNYVPGGRSATPPADESFWVASTAGGGTQIVEWDVVEGEWIVVLMNADGSAVILADVTVGVQSGALLTITMAGRIRRPLRV